MASHPDADHIGGMDTLLERFNPNMFFIFKDDKQSPEYLKLVNSLSNIQNAHLTYEDDFKINELDFNVLWPIITISPLGIDNVNNASYGIEINFNNFTFVTLGDIESLKVKMQSIKL